MHTVRWIAWRRCEPAIPGAVPNLFHARAPESSCPLAKTPAWSVAVMEASRKAIMNDPAWKDGNYEAPPETAL